MSEFQKIFASVWGAIVAHVVVLLIIFDSSVGIGGAASLPPTAPPKEVTILMADLMERVETVPAEPEPEPEPEDQLDAARRAFFPTDANDPEAAAPENARFVSDRNTSAATEILPDSSLPQRYGPTTEGDSPLDALRLRNREYVDGAIDEPPASNAANTTTVSAAQPGTDLIDAEAARVGAESGQGEALESVEGADLPPENPVADTMRRPAAIESDGTEEEEMKRRSFAVPDGMSAGAPEGEDQEDKVAAAVPESEAEIGDPTDREEKQEAMVGREDGTGEVEEGDSAENRKAGSPGEAMPSGDAGLFAEGFSPQERMSVSNGTISNLGNNAVDAEATESGKYQAKVRAAIARKWHQYRAENGDFVTYGFLKVKCRIDRNGNVHDLRIEENKANSVMADFSLRAILDADLPRMSEEVAEEFGPRGLELDYDIIIY